MNDTTLVVNEVYGPVWQGEGPSTGRLCAFVRLMGCNLSCSWALPGGGRSPCDESQTWDASRFDLHAQGTRMEAAAVADKALSYGTGMVIVTGGEPLLWQGKPGWAALMLALRAGGRVEVETNGTQRPEPPWPHQYNVSPKLRSAGIDPVLALDRVTVAAFRRTGRAVFKFVVTCRDDVREAGALARLWGLDPALVWIMPAGTEPGAILAVARDVAPAVAAAGFHLTLRQQWLIHPEGEPRE
jgi:7-carboxy-7-deazaguanine synthase